MTLLSPTSSSSSSGKDRTNHSSSHPLDGPMFDQLNDTPNSSGSKEPSPRNETSDIERVELLTSHLPQSQINLLYVLLWLFGAVLSLDRLTTYSYQTIATNSFGHHSELALVNVVRSILSAIVGPPFSLICDIYGRKSGFLLGLILYTLGHIVMATSLNVPHYIGGVILYEAGANGLVISQWVVISDISSTRNRLLAFILPQTPFMIFGFISTSIYSSILPNWRWGIGMFAILGPATLLPLILVLEFNERRAVKRGWIPRQGTLFADLKPPTIIIPSLSYTSNFHSPSPHLATSSTPKPTSSSRTRFLLLAVKQAAVRVDLIGLFLLTASLCALLIPLTLASASQAWSNYQIIIPLALGGALLPAFLLWEIKFARHPLMPLSLLKHRSFLAGGLVLTLFWIAYNVMSDYLATYLYVVKATSSTAQQNVSILYSFSNACASIPIGIVVRYCRRLKLFTLFGFVLLTLGFGLMLNINQNSTAVFDIVSSQVVIGIGGAFAVATIQANVQVVVPRAQVAMSISSLNIFSSIGNAIGAALAGSLWTNLIPSKLERTLSTDEQPQIAMIFSEPLTWIVSNPIGSDLRTKVIEAYFQTMQIMMIVSVSICAITIFLSCFMSNPKLNDTLSTSCLCQDREVQDSNQVYPCSCKSSQIDVQSSNLLGEDLFDKIEKAFSKSSSTASS